MKTEISVLSYFHYSVEKKVEATTLNQRTTKLLPQDEFIRENIREDDIVIVSIGGNDVALLPAPCTICAMAGKVTVQQRERVFFFLWTECN